MLEQGAFQTTVLWVLLAIALLAIGYAFLVRRQIVSKTTGTDIMQLILPQLKKHIDTYVRRQIPMVGGIAVVAGVACAATAFVLSPSQAALQQVGESATMQIAVGRGIAFFIGALVAFVASAIALTTAADAVVKAAAASEKGYNPALQVSTRSGAVAGFLAVGLVLLVSALVVWLMGGMAADILVGVGPGGLVVAIFLAMSSKKYTPVISEPAQPPDDSREETATNDPQAGEKGKGKKGKKGKESVVLSAEQIQATADLAQDVVQQSSAIAPTLFGAVASSVAAALLSGIALATSSDATNGMRFVFYPLLMVGIGLIASLVGFLLIKTDDQRRNARAALSRGFLTTIGVACVGLVIATFFLMGDPESGSVDWVPLLAALVGTLIAVIVERVTYTSAPVYFNPYKKVNRNSAFAGMVMGRTPNLWGLIIPIIAVGVCWFLSGAWGLSGIFYTLALATPALLLTSAILMMIDITGSINHQAHTVSTIAGLSKNARNTMEDLDETGAMMRGVSRGNMIAALVMALVALVGAVL